jgi:hypothetical protein
LRVSARKIDHIRELVDRAGSGELINPATGARNGANDFEWVAPSLVLEGTVAAFEAGNKVPVIVTLPEGDKPAMLCAVGVFIIPAQPVIAKRAARSEALSDRTVR